MTDTEASQIARALWKEPDKLPSDALFHAPAEPSARDWAFLLLPEPEPGIAEQCFRQKWLTTDHTGQNTPHEPAHILWQVGNAIEGLKVHQRQLDLSEIEQAYLLEIIERWLEIPVPPLRVPYFEVDVRKAIHAIEGLGPILIEMQIQQPIADKLHDKFEELNESEISGFGFVAGLVKALPDRLPELASSMRLGLASENEDIVIDAVKGLRRWATASAKFNSQIQLPPKDLIREIGVIIATRRQASLDVSLQMAKWIFDHGNGDQKEAISELTLHGLEYLEEELRYNRNHELSDKVPWLRWCSTHLALSMEKHGFADAPVVSRWLRIAENDPLPEVRYAKHPALSLDS